MSNLYDTDKYTVIVGISTEKDNSSDVYTIINKETGICEAETTVLPQAIIMAKEFTDMLIQLTEEDSVAGSARIATPDSPQIQ